MFEKHLTIEKRTKKGSILFLAKKEYHTEERRKKMKEIKVEGRTEMACVKEVNMKR